MKRLVTVILAVAVVGMTAPAFAFDADNPSRNVESAEYGRVDNPIWQMKSGREPGNLISLLGVTDGKKPTSGEIVFAGSAAEEVPHGEQGI